MDTELSRIVTGAAIGVMADRLAEPPAAPPGTISFLLDSSSRQKRLMAIGCVCSLMFHAAAFATIAHQWRVLDQKPALVGNVNIVTIQSSPSMFRAGAKAPTYEFGLDTEVVVLPHEALVAKRRFVPVPTELAMTNPQSVDRPASDVKSVGSEPTLAAVLAPRRDIADARDVPPVESSPESNADQSEPPRRKQSPPTATIASSPGSIPQPVGFEPGTLPELLNNAPPIYPQEALQHEWEGTVILRLQIAADGRVGALEIASSSGYSVLDAAAASAVKHWRFRPATQGGYAAAMTVRLPVVFELRLR